MIEMPKPKVQTKLLPHQERAVESFKESKKGVILAHAPGLGKTLTSIKAALESGKPVEVLVPASLVDNYKKEILKHTGLKSLPENVRIRSHQAFVLHPEMQKDSIVVVDEAHRLRNIDSLLTRRLMEQKHNVNKILPMTGSVIYNNPQDLGSLYNLISDKKEMYNPKDFVDYEMKKPPFLYRLLGVSGGKVPHIHNKEKLMEMMQGKIDYQGPLENREDFPSQTDIVHKIPMDKRQYELYDKVVNKSMPWRLRMKLKMNIPLTNAEQAYFNAFSVKTRQMSNTMAPFADDDKELKKISPKIDLMHKNILQGIKKDPNYKAIAYSNFLGGGLNELSARLKKHNVSHELFTGALSRKQKKEMLERYNRGETKVLGVSSSGAEGLDTKGTKEVHVMEPHWNNEKIRQVVARAVRYKSHAHLPPEERHVNVRHYHATEPQPGLVKRTYRRILRKKPPTLVDEFLHSRSAEKDQVTDEIKKILEQATKRHAV